MGLPLPLLSLFINHLTIAIAFAMPSDPLNLRAFWVNLRRCLMAPLLTPLLSDGVLADSKISRRLV